MPVDLAAVVPTDRVDHCLDDLDDRGVYDADRRLRAVDEGHVAIPITRRVDHPAIDSIERGLAGEPRLRTLADHLRARGWTGDELDHVPSSYARIGDLILVDGWPTHRPEDVGAALLDLHGDGEAVLVQLGIDGVRRRPTLAHLAGESRTRTVHREHGIDYGLDLTEVMFSPGNQRERRRMGGLVGPDEHVVDLCAGIGYFTLPMAVAGGRVSAVERTAEAYRWLTSNVTRNGIDDRVVPIRSDCRGYRGRADRVVVGHLPVHDCRGDPERTGGGYLDAALRALDGGGWIHVHGLAYAGTHVGARRALERRLARREVSCREISVRRVKSVAPRTDHLVFDARVRAPTG